MSEATTDRALAGNEEEEEVLPPEPTTKSIILGEVVGCFLLSVLGLGIGVSATLWVHPVHHGSLTSGPPRPAGL